MIKNFNNELDKEDFHTLFVIPARKGSKRLPGKNNEKIAGKSLLENKIYCCKKSNLGDIVVTSDCPTILSEAKNNNLKYIRERPGSLCGDGPTTPIVYDAVKFYEKESKKKVDIIILSQITTPFILAHDFKDSFNLFKNSISQFNSLIACKKIDNNILWTLYQDSKNESYKLPSKIIQEFKNFIIGKDSFIPNGGIYILKRSDLKKTGSLYELPVKIFQMDDKKSIDIDYREDLELAKIYSKEFFKK